jgi:hypothetical protein
MTTEWDQAIFLKNQITIGMPAMPKNNQFGCKLSLKWMEKPNTA